MPSRKQPRNVAEQVQDDISQEITDLVTEIAAEEGPAPHAAYVSADHEVTLWGQQDPQVDHPTLVGQLQAGAVPPELVDPHGQRPLALVKAHPELAPLFGQPLDQEMATMLATLAEYPYRLALLSPYQDDPKASVQKSDSLTARWRKRLPAQRSQPIAAAAVVATQPLPQPLEVPEVDLEPPTILPMPSEPAQGPVGPSATPTAPGGY